MMRRFVVKEIRRITPNHHNTLVTTIYKNFADISNQDGAIHTPQEISKLLKSSDFIGLFVYTEEKTIAGYLIGELKRLDDGRYVYYISYIYVANKYRNNKIGTYLMDLLIKKCKTIWGINFIVLTCDTKDPKIVKFYQNFGFIPDPVIRTMRRHDVMTLYL